MTDRQPICLKCLSHPGWATGDLAARKQPRDVCRACLGSGLDQQCRPVPGGFWPQVDHQLDRIRDQKLTAFDQVRAVLLDDCYDAVLADVNLNDERRFDDDSAFFAGSGGDRALTGALRAAGWTPVRSEAPYYCVMRHIDSGEEVTYIEGDLQRGDTMIRIR